MGEMFIILLALFVVASLTTKREREPFKFIRTITLKVPKDYSVENSLLAFRKKYASKFRSFNPCINDKSLSNASYKLTPGEKFEVHIYQINCVKVSFTNCLSFLRSRDGIFLGAHGLALLFSEHGDELPMWNNILSFDKKNSLCKDINGETAVPYILHEGNCSYDFDLESTNGLFFKNNFILCFTKVPKL